LSYWVSRHSEIVGAHLLGCPPAVDVLKHLLQEFHHLVGFDVIACLPSRVLNPVALPTWVHLVLQGRYSVDQPVGGHADPSQTEFF
jgi:hypothetical protein